jgi:predicted RNA-binding protein
MGEASAFIIRADQEELVLKSVDINEQEENQIKLINIFGEQKVLPARIKKMSLVDHKIFLEENKS